MTADDFVSNIKIQTSDGAVPSTTRMITEPPGRSPSDRLIALSKWFKELTEEDRKMAEELMKESAEQAVFSFLCILDGVKVFDSPSQKGKLELYYVNENERTLLNDPRNEYLHNLYKSETSAK